jgi:hypothetical protein
MKYSSADTTVTYAVYAMQLSIIAKIPYAAKKGKPRGKTAYLNAMLILN